MQLFIAGEIIKLRNEDLDESERSLKNVLCKELKRPGADCKVEAVTNGKSGKDVARCRGDSYRNLRNESGLP